MRIILWLDIFKFSVHLNKKWLGMEYILHMFYKINK